MSSDIGLVQLFQMGEGIFHLFFTIVCCTLPLADFAPSLFLSHMFFFTFLHFAFPGRGSTKYAAFLFLDFYSVISE